MLQTHITHTLPRFIFKGRAKQFGLYTKRSWLLAVREGHGGQGDQSRRERRRPGTRVEVGVKKNLRAIWGLEWTGLGPKRMTHEVRGKDAQFPAERCGDDTLDEIVSLESRPPAAWRTGTVIT